MSDSLDVQLRKGVLDLCVLAILARGESYAYEIAQQLAEQIGMGEGTIYPLMRRLQNDGLVDTYLVESSSGPSRKYYKLTKTGKAAYAKQKSSWIQFARSVDEICKEPGRDPRQVRSRSA